MSHFDELKEERAREWSEREAGWLLMGVEVRPELSWW